MDGIGLGGVIFIWIAFLWPVIVSSTYVLFRSDHIASNSRLWWIGTFIGYGLYLGSGPLAVFLISIFEIEGDMLESREWLIWAGLLVGFVFVTTLLLLSLKKLERPVKSSPNK